MTLAHKVKKAFRLKTYADVWFKLFTWPILRWKGWIKARSERRIEQRRRSLTVENILEDVDRAALERIRKRFSGVDNDPKIFWTKYLDYRKWLALNIRYAHELGLPACPPRDVLDLGCGSGYFLLVCRQLGSRVVGLDLDEDHVFNELVALFKLQRVVWRIRRSTKLPNFDRKFDLITAWMVCFNLPMNRPAWRVQEWDFFLRDTASHLKPCGKMILSLNKQLDNGELYSDEVRRYFESCGAFIEGKRLTFTKEALIATSGRRENVTEILL